MYRAKVKLQPHAQRHQKSPSVPGAFSAPISSLASLRTIILSPEASKAPIGRASGNSSKGLVATRENGYFNSPVMSRKHAELEMVLTPSKQVIIRDLQSMHGTFIDGERLKEGQDAVIVSGTEITLGAEVGRGETVYAPTTFVCELSWEETEEIPLPARESFPPIRAGYGLFAEDGDSANDGEYSSDDDDEDDDADSLDAQDGHEKIDDEEDNASDRASIIESSPPSSPRSDPVMPHEPPTVMNQQGLFVKDRMASRFSPANPKSTSATDIIEIFDNDVPSIPTKSRMPTIQSLVNDEEDKYAQMKEAVRKAKEIITIDDAECQEVEDDDDEIEEVSSFEHDAGEMDEDESESEEDEENTDHDLGVPKGANAIYEYEADTMAEDEAPEVLSSKPEGVEGLRTLKDSTPKPMKPMELLTQDPVSFPTVGPTSWRNTGVTQVTNTTNGARHTQWPSAPSTSMSTPAMEKKRDFFESWKSNSEIVHHQQQPDNRSLLPEPRPTFNNWCANDQQQTEHLPNLFNAILAAHNSTVSAERSSRTLDPATEEPASIKSASPAPMISATFVAQNTEEEVEVDALAELHEMPYNIRSNAIRLAPVDGSSILPPKPESVSEPTNQASLGRMPSPPLSEVSSFDDLESIHSKDLVSLSRGGSVVPEKVTVTRTGALKRKHVEMDEADKEDEGTPMLEVTEVVASEQSTQTQTHEPLAGRPIKRARTRREGGAFARTAAAVLAGAVIGSAGMFAALLAAAE